MIRFELASVHRYSSFYYYFKKSTSRVAGILVGISVVLFRVCLDWIMQGSFHMTESFICVILCSSIILFMAVFSLCRVNKFHQKPIIIGCLGISIEIVASMSELAFYHMLVLGTTITISEVNKLLFFVVSLHLVLNMMNLYETKLKESQVRKEMKIC